VERNTVRRNGSYVAGVKEQTEEEEKRIIQGVNGVPSVIWGGGGGGGGGGGREVFGGKGVGERGFHFSY